MADERTIEAAAKRLVEKLDAVAADPQFKNVWVMAKVHGYPYTGPNFTDELTDLRAALAAAGRVNDTSYAEVSTEQIQRMNEHAAADRVSEIDVRLLEPCELANFIRERFPLYLNFGNKAVSYSWNADDLADEMLQWLRGEIRVHGQKAEQNGPAFGSGCDGEGSEGILRDERAIGLERMRKTRSASTPRRGREPATASDGG